MRTNLFLAVAVALTMAMASPVEAKKKPRVPNIDFGNMSCREFLDDVKESDKEDIGAVLLWLDGYLSGVTGDTVLNWKKLEVITERLLERCQARGKTMLLDAIREVGAE
ncbi:MAG: hypothetical protein HQL96_05340 [Magnetococcales bacterium]|nr:hypothetical protein [Magnetococcales bacterium]